MEFKKRIEVLEEKNARLEETVALLSNALFELMDNNSNKKKLPISYLVKKYFIAALSGRPFSLYELLHNIFFERGSIGRFSYQFDSIKRFIEGCKSKINHINGIDSLAMEECKKELLKKLKDYILRNGNLKKDGIQQELCEQLDIGFKEYKFTQEELLKFNSY